MERRCWEVSDAQTSLHHVPGRPMTINIGAVAITFIGLVVGLCGLGLAWRFVRGLPMDEHPKAPDTSDASDAGDPSEDED